MKRLPLAAIAAAVLLVGGVPAGADTSPQTLPFSQDWTNIGLITANDNWSGVPGIIGYRGDDLTTATGTDPQTITVDGSATPVNVIANQTNPNGLATGGVAEFHLTDPVVALQGSGTSDVPHLVFTLNTSGLSNIRVAYNLRDIDGSADNAVQPVALQYRVGASGSYTNVPAGFVADASTGPSLATLVTPVSVVLPAAVNNQPTVQARVLTTNAVGNDEWIGVDDIAVTAGAADDPPAVQSTTPADGAADVALNSNLSVTFSEPVDVTGNWFSISCGSSGAHTAAVSGGPTTFTLDPSPDFANSESCTLTVVAANVSDQDTNDPPDNMTANASVSFTTVEPPSPVFFSEYVEGTSNNKALEVYNGTGSPVDLGAQGYSIQMFFNGSSSPATTVNLTGTVAAGDVYVVATSTADAAILAAADQVSSASWFNGDDAIVLRRSTSTLDVIGQIGLDPGTEWGTGLTSTADNTLRRRSSITQGDSNGADAFEPALEWNGFAVDTFGGLGSHNTGDEAPRVISTTPAADATEVPVDSNVSITFDEAVDVTDPWFTISCSTSGAHAATATGGPITFTLDPSANFVENETCTVTVVAANVADEDTEDPPNTMAADFVLHFTTPSAPIAIHDVQGATHISPYDGQVVKVLGVVTAKSGNGFWAQDQSPDADVATAEGIFVFTASAPSVNVGDSVRVNGRVQEFRPGGATNGNLTTTELSSPSVTVLSSGNPLPAPVVVGTGGRVPPNTVIEDDATGSVETSGVFDPATDGLDFYESLEGMRVQLNNAVAVGPTETGFGETPVIGDDGANASVRTSRGGILLRSDDGNPERVTLDDVLAPLPNVNVGDHYSAPIVGIMDYNFGNPFLNVTTLGLTAIHDGVTREVSDPVAPGELSISTFNFENLAATNAQSKFDSLASLIVNNLRSPDLLSGEEVQDNNGATSDGTVDASQTLTRLVDAIAAAGGPTYQWREIDPVNNQDGGEPGGNIRQVFLFRTDRGLSFVDRPGGGSTTPNAVTGSGTSTQLAFSPGRIDPTNTAFNSSRKPLAGEFMYRGHKLFAIVNHFNSKGGDDPLRGRFQPPTRISEVQRHQQAQIVNDFVDSILAGDSAANVVVLGDLNDFEFSETVDIVKGGVLTDLMDSLPLNQRYSYEFEGNAQVLDHILLSGALTARPFVFDPVHVNAEFFDQASDHDPSVVRVRLNDAPTADAGGPYSVPEGGSVGLAATGNDGEGGALTYAWDLDNNGTYETSGQTATFSAAALDGTSIRTVGVRVTDDAGQTGTDTATVTVTNVAPTATFNAPASSFAGFPFTLSLTSPHDPSSADTAAGFMYAFDCGDGSGYGAFGASPSRSCPTTDVGPRSVRGKLKDKDGGVTEYTGTVQVVVTFDSLCALVRSYARRAADADELCAKLADAATGDKEKKLKAFRSQVDAKTGSGAGKSFTAEQGALLKLLSTRL